MARTLQEQEALKEADLGGVTIIMNKDYKELVKANLNDEVYYTKLKTSPENVFNLNIKSFYRNSKAIDRKK